MKFATYNVWYPNIGIRAEQLIHEINTADADIIGLQEVPPDFYRELVSRTDYAFTSYNPYTDANSDDGEMGLAFLCRYPFIEEHFLFQRAEHANSIAASVLFEKGGIRFSVTNVHLPWDSVLEKEKQIVATDLFIRSQKDKAHFFVLLGDFNCGEASSVNSFLLGHRTLRDCEANPTWNDLAAVHAALNGYETAPTLDFINNPRWRGKNTNYIPERCDRIYIMEAFDWDNSFGLRNISVFGKEVSTETGFAPSDHYGVLAEADFEI